MSDFIETNWTTSLYGYGPKANSYSQLDRPLLSKHHQVLGKLCTDAKFFIDDAISTFNKSVLITASVLSRTAFELQTTKIIADFIERTPTYFRRLLFFTNELLRNTLAPTAFNTDWLLEVTDWWQSMLLRSVPRMFSNGTCNCITSTTCQEPMRIGPPNLVFPGLVVGCWPIDGLRMSTLECFYSSSCIESIINFLDYYTQMDGSSPVDFILPTVPTLIVTPLNSSIPSRFPLNITIGNLINELFIEQWYNKSIYENYFAACAPTVCRYEYVSRNSIVYMITLILSLYGGLTFGLRFIVWNGLQIYYKIKARFSNRIDIIQSFNSDNMEGQNE